MTFSEAVRFGENAGGNSVSRREAVMLLSHVTGTTPTEIAVNPERLLNRKEHDSFLKLLAKRGRHVPLQYLLGVWQFMGLDFFVDPSVLIPRQDTEALVEAVIKLKPRRVLDLCAGSGCIGISIAKLTDAEVLASDISADALAVAEKNAELNGVEGVIRFVQSDLFESIPDEKFDLIVSNPPYIPSDEIPGLQEEVKDFEPRLALDGGADGLDFYRRIIPAASEYLTDGGSLYFEAGPADGIKMLLEANGYKNVTVIKDLAGKDRVVGGILLV